MPKLKLIRIAPATPNGTNKIVLTVSPVMAFSEKLTPYTILKPIYRSFVNQIIKLHNVLNVLPWRHNSKCCGKVLRGTTSISTESSENSKISPIPRETKKIKFFPQGTYMGQNVIPKALTILDPKTDGIPEIYQLENE